VQSNAALMRSFQGEMVSIMKIHEADCIRASGPQCAVCGSPRVKALQTPMSYLHIVHNPSIAVQVLPICNQGKCEIERRQDIQRFMMEAASQGPASFDTQEVLRYNICGKTEDMKRCGQTGKYTRLFAKPSSENAQGEVWFPVESCLCTAC
jgi:hypothetical protein